MLIEIIARLQALPEDGQLVACEKDEAMLQLAREAWTRAGVLHKVGRCDHPSCHRVQALSFLHLGLELLIYLLLVHTNAAQLINLNTNKTYNQAHDNLASKVDVRCLIPWYNYTVQG